MRNTRKDFSTGTEIRLRNDICRFAQEQHLSASLFSLDEIVIEPKVLSPVIQYPSSIELAPTDSVSLTIPYMPDWPELAAVFNGSTMSLIEALQGGANIILTGHPGSGKTVALAWLASRIARNEKGLGKLSDLLPIYIHATDLHSLYSHANSGAVLGENVEVSNSRSIEQQSSRKIKNADEAIELLIQAMARYVSPSLIPKLPRVIYSSLNNQKIILLLDRVDELPPNQASVITMFLKLLLEKYPNLRIVTAMSYDNLAGLPTIGFSLLGLAAWSDTDRDMFLRQWSQQWEKWVAPMDKSHYKKVNSHYLNSWLKVNSTLLKPLEYTLKVWAAFSGDILGIDGPSAIEAYIRRMTHNINDARSGLERFALQLLIEMDITSNPYVTDRIKTEYEIAIQSSGSHNNSEQGDATPESRIKPPVIIDIPGLDTLTNNGFLISYQGSRFGFSHPVISGYLAGKALSEAGVIKQIENQPSWIGRNLAFYYLARYGDVSTLIQQYLQDDDILHTNHLLIARWLQIAPKNRAWRTIILRTLATILQKERETINLAGKITAAMAFSGDEGVSIYFRQLLKAGHSNLKQLGALGCGVLADKKSIEELNNILHEESPTSIRSASLALAAIGDKQSLEILASSLLNGSEPMRRYAAEALANNPIEGHPALQEGSRMEDLLVRRSVIFGLIRLDQPWARKIVENLQLDDNEWVVRNAAIQAFDELQRKNNYAPQPLPDLTEVQWLINYATKIGTTVAPGKPAEELVYKALMNGNEDEKLNALEYCRNKCNPESMNLIFNTYSKSSGDLRNAAYYVLWLMAIAGIKLPYTFE